MIIRSLFSFSVVFLLMLTIITSVHAESEESVIEIYDKDQNLVKVIEVTDQPVASSDELNGMSDEASIQSAQRYVFGRTTFSNFVWLNGGTYYRNPGLMAMEVENRPEAFAVQLYHQGSYAGEAVWRNVSGWASLDWRTSGLIKEPGFYAFRFVNKGSGSVIFMHGELWYNY